jgi:integrase
MQQKRTRDQDGIYVRKDSPYWWASWIDGQGKAARRSTGVRKEDDPRQVEAKRVRAQFIAESLSAKPKRGDERTFEDLMLAYMEGPGKLKKSHRRDGYACAKLAEVFSGRALDSITGSDVRAYIQHRQSQGIGAGGLNREIGLMSSATNWSRRELEWDIPNPWQSRKLPEPPPRNRWLTREEVARLLSAAEALPRAEHLPDFIRLGLYTGMRPGELMELAWRRVDLECGKHGMIYFGVDDQKSERHGSIPLNQQAKLALLSRLRFREKWCPQAEAVFCNKSGQRIKDTRISFASAVQAAGLGGDVTPHILRHTFGSWLAQANVPILTISKLMRHSSIQVTARVYAHLAPATLADAVAVLDEAAPGLKLVSRA